MPWLSAAKGSVGVIDVTRPNFMSLDAFGARPNGGGELQPDGSYANYSINGYGRNELVYACIRYRAESLPQSAIRVYNDDAAGTGVPLDDHRLRRLFENPNPVTEEFEFLELSVTYKDLAGTCFWLVVDGRDGLPSQLWPLRPDLVAVLPDPRPNPPAPGYIWIYRPDPFHPEIAIPIPDAGSPEAKASQTKIIRIRYPNPNPNDPGWRYYGQPPLRPAARAVSLDNAATDFVDSLLRNHAMPSVVIETEQEITPTVHERLKTSWVNAFGGPRRGLPAFLQKGMRVNPIGLDLKTLEFPDLREQSETRICGALGVEPILVGTKVGLTHNAYKDYREARLSFWEEAMFTEQRRFLGPVRSKLLPRFQGVGRRRTKVAWDNSEVLALKEATGALWQRATEAFARGGITRADFRSMLGLPAQDGDDIYLVPAGVQAQEVGQPLPSPDQGGPVSAALLAAEFGIELREDELPLLQARFGAMALEG